MNEPTSSETPAETVPVAAEPPVPHRSHASRWLLLALLVAAIVAALWWYAPWSLLQQKHRTDVLQALNARVQTLTESVAQLRDRNRALHDRLDDGEQVDKSVRAQMLALNQRMQALESATANLADTRVSGRESLALDETEWLLTLAGERYTLFHDVPATITAYRAADTALSQVRDATFSGVRDDIAAEIDALDALHAANSTSVATRLATMRGELAQLPAGRSALPPPEQPVSGSKLWRILGGLVRIHHDGDAATQVALHDPALARELIALDLRDAEAAALARDTKRFRTALAAVHAQISASFAPDAAPVKALLDQCDALGQVDLAPPAPKILGTALKSLRNLRATHALRNTPPTPRPASKAEAGIATGKPK